MREYIDKFPTDFLWGGGTGATQYEGGFDQGGRGKSNYDYINRLAFEDRENDLGAEQLSYERFAYAKEHERELFFPYRFAVDFYHRYKEDIRLFAEMGFKVFRMSVSWSRLFPTGYEEKPNPEGVAFYHNVFAELQKYGIEPLVTMVHYEVPLYLEETINGWESPQMIPLFVKYGKTLIDEYKEQVKYWLPFNEINAIICQPYCNGGMFIEKAKKDYMSTVYQALHHQYIAAAQIVKYAHDTAPGCKMGSMIARLECYPYTCSPADVAQALLEDQTNLFSYDVMAEGAYTKRMYSYYKSNNINIDYVDGYEEILAQGKCDFLAFSYYQSYVASGDEEHKKEAGNLVKSLKNPYIGETQFGWGVDPEGLRITLNRLYDRYKMPLLIVENGLGAVDKFENGTVHDEYRIDYLRKHIVAIKEAINDGVDVMGYITWGCVDCRSASFGDMDKRYGFIYVDADNEGNGTYDRYKKDSFYWYKQVISTNGENLSS